MTYTSDFNNNYIYNNLIFNAVLRLSTYQQQNNNHTFIKI
jgi:hypothetical protein